VWQYNDDSMDIRHDRTAVNGEQTGGTSINSDAYFHGREYENLVSNMQKLREMIHKTKMVESDTDDQEDRDAKFIFTASLVKGDLAAIRVKLYKDYRNDVLLSSHTLNTIFEDSELLERDTNGHVIHNSLAAKAARTKRIMRSPDVRVARRVACRRGVWRACFLWLLARYVFLDFSFCGVYATHATWAFSVFALVYICRAKQIDRCFEY
jgi:hypothetical protein